VTGGYDGVMVVVVGDWWLVLSGVRWLVVDAWLW
jgi:hypothetical protein